jgi:hypothetical protein
MILIKRNIAFLLLSTTPKKRKRQNDLYKSTRGKPQFVNCPSVQKKERKRTNEEMKKIKENKEDKEGNKRKNRKNRKKEKEKMKNKDKR